jgi:ABC-type multidrug transport system fused ATPase/permease subunit
MRVFAPAQALMGLYASLATARVSWRRVLELLDARPDVAESPDAVPLLTARGEIAFERVTLITERDARVLDEVSFSVAPGESLALVGASGVGKSTIAFLAARLLDPDRGVVRLDGHDLRMLALADVRRHIVLVEQDPVLLHATIGENIRYLRPDAGEAEVRISAHAAGIALFVEGLPQQYDTVVGERGLALSAGERQRIALARAFLANPAVLVLDEPTAALDPVSERHVIDGYRSIMRGRTTMLITHRRELAMAADRVVVLSGSRVVEEGTPHELLSGRGSIFAALFEAASMPTRSAPNLGSVESEVLKNF